MQTTRQHALNVIEADRLSFMMSMFDADFILAELHIHGLAQMMLPECDRLAWHYILLPEGGGYMMPDSGKVNLINSENFFDRTVSADAAGIIMTSLAINQRCAILHEYGHTALTRLYLQRDAQLWKYITGHAERNAIFAALD